MKHYIEDLVTRLEKTRIKTTCDFCESELPRHLYDQDSVEIEHKKGFFCPDGGSGTSTEVDMCGACFTTKFIPWCYSQGVTPTTREINF